MADDDDIKPDAPETVAAAGDVAAAAGDAPVPREPEEGEVAEAAEDATGAEGGAPEPEASATSESVGPPATEAEATAPDAVSEGDAIAEPAAASEEGDAVPPEEGAAEETAEGDAESDEEALVEANLPPPGPPKPEEPKDDCPKCAGGGAPAWMATFADMATLLMAFFVLLLSFAETEVPKFKQVAGSLKQAFGIEKIVPKVTIPMARSIMVENFTPAVAERSVMDVKEQQSDFVRGDFIEKKTEEGEYDDPLDSDFQQVQEALEEELNKGMADVRIENGEIKVTLLEPASAGGQQGSEGEGKGGQVAQETLDAVAKVAEVSAELRSKVGVHLADQAQGSQTGANANRRQSRSGDSSGMSKYDRLRADLSEEIAAGLAEVEKDGDKIIVRLASQGSFTSGSSDLRQAFTPTLTRLGNSLAKYPGSVMVEGHTDNVPVAFSERFKSNWDLSAARAASIADFLLNSTNMEGGNVQIAGFADTRPLDSNDTATGRARNRRIEVIVDDN
jgi:chemotaxis protein MotB